MAMTKPNVFELVGLLRKAADNIDAYHKLEPLKPSNEVWTIVLYAEMLLDARDGESRDDIIWKLKKATANYRAALKGLPAPETK